MRGSDKRMVFHLDLNKYINLKTLIGGEMPVSVYIRELVLTHLDENAEKIKQILIAKGRYEEPFRIVPNTPEDHGA